MTATYRERVDSARRLANELEKSREGEPFASARAWMSRAFELCDDISRQQALPHTLRERASNLWRWRINLRPEEYDAGPPRSFSIKLLRALARDIEGLVAKNIELSGRPAAGKSRVKPGDVFIDTRGNERTVAGTSLMVEFDDGNHMTLETVFLAGWRRKS